MALTRGFVQNSGTTPLDTRLMDMARYVRNVDNTPRVGELYGDINPIKATGSMAVSLVDTATFLTSRSVNDGVCVLVNVGALNVTLDPAPTANSRYDVVWVKQNDSTNGDADSLPTLGKTTGTAAASPSLANTLALVPTGALVLANILVPANVTATNASGVVITNTVLQTALLGAPIRYRNIAEMRADAANVIDGGTAYIKGGAMYYLRGGVWTRSDAQTFGVLTGSGTMATGTTNVTMPATSTGQYTSDNTILPISGGGASFTCPYAGYYDVEVAANWGSSTTGERFLEVTTNLTSVSPVRLTDRRPTGSTSGASGDGSVAGTIYCNAGDVINLRGWQNSGGNLAYATRMSVTLKALA